MFKGFNLKKIAPATYEIPIHGGMRVPGLLIMNEELMRAIDIERPLEQVCNVAYLPGIVGHSIAMPDMHWGYGFPIGGVAAMRMEDGVVSPGGVGYDINCGVRLAIIPLPFKSISSKDKKNLLHRIFKLVPSGVGQGHQKGHKSLSEDDYKAIIQKGARWSVEQGFGLQQDLEHCENHGVLKDGDLSAVSSHAQERGRQQLGSIGSGNHFVEIGLVDKIFLSETAQTWGIEQGWTYVLIHSGSRGFGHQICQDTLNTFVKAGFAEGLPDKQLVAAPLKSTHAQHYLKAMAAAANFAFNNRQMILHAVRQAFKEELRIPNEDVRLIYDVCHNIVKFEKHGGETLCVHRKGATRAFGPGAEELAPIFQKTGQPVLVPGDMGRASYLLAGLGNPLTWCSCCHGAGREQSRHQGLKHWKGRNPFQHMEQCGVDVMSTSSKTLAEEMPEAYKDVHSVVDAVQEARLANKVAVLKPKLVIKG